MHGVQCSALVWDRTDLRGSMRPLGCHKKLRATPNRTPTKANDPTDQAGSVVWKEVASVCRQQQVHSNDKSFEIT